MQRRFEQVILILTGLLSVPIAILDWLDWLPQDAVRIPNLTLLAVGLVAAHLVLERRSKLDNIEHLVIDGTERIIRSLEGVDIERFANDQELFEYIAKRMLEAENSVDDLTFGFKEPLITPAGTIGRSVPPRMMCVRSSPVSSHIRPVRGYLEATLEGNCQSIKRDDEVKSSMNRFDPTGVIG